MANFLIVSNDARVPFTASTSTCSAAAPRATAASTSNVGAAEPLARVLGQGHQRDAVRPLVAVDHHLAEQRRPRLEGVLQRLRRDLLAARGHDQVLLAIGDAQEAVLELADVAGVEPAVGLDATRRSPPGCCSTAGTPTARASGSRRRPRSWSRRCPAPDRRCRSGTAPGVFRNAAAMVSVRP